MAKLFISYSRVDKWAQELGRKLRNNEVSQHDVFVDYRDIHAGINFWDVICERIEECDALIYVLSPDSVKSVYCLAEVRYALALNKPILPLMLRNCDFPDFLNERSINYRNVPTEMSDVLLLIERSLNEFGRNERKNPQIYAMPNPQPPRPPQPRVDESQKTETRRIIAIADKQHESELVRQLTNQLQTLMQRTEPTPIPTAPARRPAWLLGGIGLIAGLLIVILVVLVDAVTPNNNMTSVVGTVIAQTTSEMTFTETESAEVTFIFLPMPIDTATDEPTATTQPTDAPTNTLTASNTPQPELTPTITPTPTHTPSPTSTPTATITPTPTNTLPPTAIHTPTMMPTLSPDEISSIFLVGHGNNVNGAMELSDGRLLSWSGDRTLRLWDRDGLPLAVLEGHISWVNGAMELSDGRLLSWGSDRTLRLWDSDGLPLAVLEGHTGTVNGAIELSDGRLLSWGNDNILRLWDRDGVPIVVLAGSGVIELSDGRLLSRGTDRTLRLWDRDGLPLAVLEGQNGAIELSNGKLLSWGSNTLRLWDSDGLPLAVLEGHTGTVNGAIELSDGRLLSWGNNYPDDYTLRLWNRDGLPLNVLQGHINRVAGAIELSDGKLLSWGDYYNDNILRLWDTNGVPIAVLLGHRYNVGGAIELSDGKLLSWGDYGSQLRLWDNNGLTLAVLRGSVQGAIELSDGRLLSWGDAGTLRLWYIDTVAPAPVRESRIGIITERVNLRVDASTQFRAIMALDPGASVEILGENPDGNWLYILSDDGTTGWVATEYVQIQP